MKENRTGRGLLTRFLAFMAYAAGTVAIQVVGMIYGWGLEPVSWGVIIGIGYFGALLWAMVGKAIIDEWHEG